MGIQFDDGPLLTVEMALCDSIATPYKDVVAIDGPAVWYRLGDAVGSGTAADSGEPGGFPATVHGTVTFGQTGLVSGDPDGAALFDGTSGYLQAAASSAYMPVSALTLSVMVKLAAFPPVGAAAGVIIFGNTSLQIDRFGGLLYEFKDTGGRSGVLGTADTLSVGVASWIVVTDDGTTVSLYLDGVLLAQRPRAEIGFGLGVIPGAGFDPTTSPLYVGGPPGELLNGVIDEVAIWKDIALTADQVMRQADARAALVDPVWTEMVDADGIPRLESVSWSRGPSYESADPVPGQAAFVLENSDQALTPGNTGSPWFPFVDTEREVRVRATYDADDYALFRGETTGPFELSWEPAQTPSVGIPAVDALADLGLAQFSDALEAGPYGARINQALDHVYFRRDKRSIDTGNSSGGAHAAGSQTDVLTELTTSTRSEQGRAFADGDNTVTFHDRWRRWKNRTVFAVFGDQPGEIPYSQAPQPQYSNQWVVNQAVVDREDSGTEVVVDDPAGQARRRLRSSQFSTNLKSDDDAVVFGLWQVGRNRSPETRIESIVIDAVAVGAAAWPVVLGMEIGKRVQVRTPSAIGGDISDYYVENIAHQVGGGPFWRLTLQLSPAYDVLLCDTDPVGAGDGKPLGY